MHDAFSIGRLAALTGLPVKTIRFYSDAGLLPPSGRTEAGHRRYTAADVARLQLVWTLRRVHALSRLEAAERGRLLDRFWDRVTDGLPGSDAVDRPRAVGTPELPPTPRPSSSTPPPTPGPGATWSWSASSRTGPTWSSPPAWPTTPGCWPPSATARTVPACPRDR